MDITIYLPDELGTWAKNEGVNLSGALRTALIAERGRLATIAETRGPATTHMLRIDNRDEGAYDVRLHGTLIAEESVEHGRINRSVYLTDHGQLMVYYNDDDSGLREIEVEEVRDWLQDDDVYLAAMAALGEPAVIDIGRAG